MKATLPVSLILCVLLVHPFSPAQQTSSAPLDVAAISQKAQSGELDAMLQLGRAYFYGNGVPLDLDKGRVWLEKAADADSIDAQMLLGMAYFTGIKLPKNKEAASKYLLKVAQQTKIEKQQQDAQALARYFVGMMYRHGEGLEKSDAKAFEYQQLATDEGSVPAKYDLAVMYDEGIGTIPHKALACQLFKEAADAGHVSGMNNTGRCYEAGSGFPKDANSAIMYYTKAAEAGNRKSQNNLAILYGGSGQWDKSYFWLRVAQSLGATENQPAVEKVKAHLSAAQVDVEEKNISAWIDAHPQLKK